MSSHGSRGRTATFRAIAAFAVLSHSAGAEESLFGADVTLTTDYVSRGVSQTLSQPALQVSIGLAHESGWSAYAWGSNVDYVADGEPDDGARLELDAVVEYEHDVTERVSVAIGRIEYFNPGVDPAYDYDYGEWSGRLTLDERYRVSADWSDNIFGSGARALHLAAATGFELPAGLWFEVEIGRFDLSRASAWGEAYNHARLTLSGTFDTLTWQFACHATSSHARNAFYESAVEPRAVLSLTYALW